MATTLAKIKDWHKEATSKWSKWKVQSEEDFAFAQGEQWKVETKAQVESEGRPAYTFNEIRGVIKLIVGYQRQNRQDIKIVGVEGGDDLTAEIMTLLIKNIVSKQNAEYKFSDCFSDGVKCSRGFLEIEIDYEEDILNGIITFHHRSPFEIKVDPYSVEYDLSDAEYVIREISNLTKDSLLSRFPDQEDKINEATGKPDPDSDKNRWTLVECWYKKYTKVKFLVDTQSGDIEELSGKESKAEIKQMLKITPNLKLHERRIPKIKIASVVNEVLLQDDDSPYYPHLKTFPFIPYIADWSPSATKHEQRCQGVTTALKDPQKFINKQISMGLHIVNTSANAPWVGDEDALDEDGEAHLKQFGSRPGVYIKKKHGTELRRETPVPGTLSTFILSDKGSDMIKRISGANADLLGQQDVKSMSGKALSIRQQQGIITIQEIFDNLRFTRHIEARVLIGLILTSYSPEKVVRVCGEDAFITEEEKQQIAENPEAINVSDTALQRAGEILKNIDMTRYDIAIDEISSSPTMRAATFLTMMEMKEKGFETITEEDLIEASDLPNKAKILARIKKQAEQPQQQLPIGQITQKQPNRR